MNKESVLALPSELNQASEIMRLFLKYCHERPEGDIGHSVCRVEMLDFGYVHCIRGLSMGKIQNTAKLFTYDLNDESIISNVDLSARMKDFTDKALKAIEAAWKNDPLYADLDQPWRILTEDEVKEI